MGKLKKQILKLREEGKSYGEIQKILKCSKGTISYHCGEGQKEKTYLRWKNNSKKLINILKKRVLFFQRDSIKTFDVNDFLNKFNNIIICPLSGEKINLLENEKYHLDHIVPKTKGGANSLDNCQVVLKEFNLMKGNLLISELIENCIKILEHNGYTVTKNV